MWTRAPISRLGTPPDAVRGIGAPSGALTSSISARDDVRRRKAAWQATSPPLSLAGSHSILYLMLMVELGQSCGAPSPGFQVAHLCTMGHRNVPARRNQSAERQTARPPKLPWV